MRFSLTDDQAALAEAVRGLLDKECPPKVVRAAWDNVDLDRSLWRSLASMGVLSVLVAKEAEDAEDAEDAGGLGLDAVAMVAVLMECGRAAVPLPVVESAMVAAPLLGAGTGDALVTTDLGGPLVPFADVADRIILDDTDGLRVANWRDVEIHTATAVDRSRRLARITVAPDVGEVVGGRAERDAAFDRGALGTAAELIGLGQAMLDVTVDYAKQRQQFGVPIGSFQAVKHHLADALRELAFARPAVLRAAWSVAERQPTASRDVSMAKAMASDAAGLVARTALQCHGAIGYTVEYDLHLWMKRTWALARAWGDAGWHRHRVATAIGV
ncbi:MAG: acyl-CoA dehydrogenase family protein [Acidimicrobiales bacterium]